MLTPATHHALTLFAEWYIALCLLCCLIIVIEQRRRPAPMMRIMLWVWPITALWAGPIALWLYRVLTRDSGYASDSHAKPVQAAPHDMHGMNMVGMDMGGMNVARADGHAGMLMESSAPPTWRNVTTGTLHCGAGCTLADLVGPWLFQVMPFVLFGRLMFGEWLVEYILALITGVFFQYAAQAQMTNESGPALWWRSFKVDVLSLTAWQIGMYGWMAIAMFGLIGPMSPMQPVFWLMMQVGMLCGFLTAFPMNWWLIREGIKSAM